MLEKLPEIQSGYLVGLYLGDGYSYYSKKDRHYVVEFYLNSERDQDIVRQLESILASLEMNVFELKDKRSNVLRVRVSSKKFKESLESKVDEIFQGGKCSSEFKLGLLSGFIDAEGYVKNGEIQLTQKDRETLEIFRKIALEMGLLRKVWSAKNYKGDGVIWRLRVSTKFKYAPHNSCKVRRQYSGVGQHN